MSEEVRLVRYLFMPPPQRPNRSPGPTEAGRGLGDIWAETLQDATALPLHTQSEKLTASSSSGVALDVNTEEDEDPASSSPHAPEPQQLVLRHNPLHNMEGVLWLSIFVLVASEYKNELDGKGKRKYSAQTFQGFIDAQKAIVKSPSPMPSKLFCGTKFRP